MLIISMTSYPKRIKYVAKVFYSILSTSVSKDKYKCVLVLSTEEFPNLEKDLPDDLQLFIDTGLVEIIWTKRNTKSHKKLLPTLKKYPNEPILVIDDDILRNEDWLNSFLSDHEKYPNDIICGAFYKKISIVNKELKETSCIHDTYNTNKYAGKIMNLYKPANGTGGTLYPPNTFVDKRFFDEDLMMNCAESDDETWQYCFAILNNKKFRQLSYPHKDIFINDSQIVALNRINTLRHVAEIHKKICKAIPEFIEKMESLK